MSRDYYGAEKHIRIFKENSVTEFVDILFGSAAPGGDSGEQDAAPEGSMFLLQSGGASRVYTKIASNNNTGDWIAAGAGNSLGFRGEKIRALTNDTVADGVARDLVASPFADDDGTTLVAADFAVGEFIIADADGAPVLLEVTDVSAPNVTFSTPDVNFHPLLSENDNFIVINYLPDPDGQESQALVQKSATVMVKVGDVDWEFATGINISSGYTPGSGNVTPSDTVESAIEKLDGNNDAQDLSLGLAQGAVNFGTFTGDTLSDNASAKQLFQELEDAAEGFPEEQTGVNSATVLDSVLVDQIRACVWLVSSFDEATPANNQSVIIHGLNDGTASADAVGVRDNVSSKLKLGGNFNAQIAVVLNGAAAAQEMRLEVDSSEPGVTFTAVRLGCTPSGY